MNIALSSWALLLVVIWPLLLGAATACGPTRIAASRLVAWAALPAIIAAVALGDTTLQLPATLLGSALVLDATGRVFLLLSAAIWFACGLLSRPQLHVRQANRFAVLLTLAIAGTFALILSADVVLFFAAGTLASYALYGLLVGNDAEGVSRSVPVLVVLLVLSDLVLFELFLLLVHAAGKTDFASLREILVTSDNPGLLLGLLIVGFGIRSGVVGLHFWLAPAFVSAVPAMRPALIGFIFSAGLLGWLRLLPLGETRWPLAGDLLQWLGWIGLGFASIVGLLQVRPRSILAYAAMALTGLWMVILGAALRSPDSWLGMANILHAAVLQSGFALAALLLLDADNDKSTPRWLRYANLGVIWLAALLLVLTPISTTPLLVGIGDPMAIQLCWATVIALLVVRAVVGARKAGRSTTEAEQSPRMPRATAVLVAAGLTVAATLAAAYSLLGLVLAEFWLPAIVAFAAALGAWWGFNRFGARLPELLPGDLLVPISKGLAAAWGCCRRLADKQLPAWRDHGLSLLRRLWLGVDWSRIVDRIESRLSSWQTLLVILLLLGLVVA